MVLNDDLYEDEFCGYDCFTEYNDIDEDGDEDYVYDEEDEE